MSLNEQIVCGLLYQRFAALVDQLCMSGVAGHRAASLSGRQLDRSHVASFLRSQVPEQRLLAGKLLGEMKSEDLPAEGQSDFVNAGWSFLRKLNARAWLILLQSRDSPDHPALLQSISRLLGNFVKKTRVAEYLSLIVFETAACQEKATTAERDIKASHTQARPPRTTSRLSQADHDRDPSFSYLTWRLLRGLADGVPSTTLCLDLINRDYDYHAVKVQMERRRSIDVKEHSLADFYRVAGDKEFQLGPYYLSYLEKACADLRMAFDSSVRHIGPENLTVIRMTLEMAEPTRAGVVTSATQEH